MTSIVSPSFWRTYERLTDDERRAARNTYRRFTQDPTHPSLHFRKLGGYDRFWSVRISLDLRAVAERHEGDVIRWFWIGHHGDFDNLFG